jgi:hypothetical protein
VLDHEVTAWFEAPRELRDRALESAERYAMGACLWLLDTEVAMAKDRHAQDGIVVT